LDRDDQMGMAAASVHAATLTLDTHVDIPWPEMADPAGPTQRKVDFGKMRRGGLKAVVFIAYVPQGRRDAEGHAAAGARAEAMLRAIRGTAGDDPADRRICTTAAGVEAAARDGALAIMLGVENGHAVGRDLGRLALWRSLGAIYLTLTHDGHNDLADSARPRADLADVAVEHGGLTELGRSAIREMNRVGLMVDVSHALARCDAAGLRPVAHARRRDPHRLPRAARPPAGPWTTRNWMRCVTAAASRRSPPCRPSCACPGLTGRRAPRSPTTWTMWTTPCGGSASTMWACPPTSMAEVGSRAGRMPRPPAR
jgi:hypothetical protein